MVLLSTPGLGHRMVKKRTVFQPPRYPQELPYEQTALYPKRAGPKGGLSSNGTEMYVSSPTHLPRGYGGGAIAPFPLTQLR